MNNRHRIDDVVRVEQIFGIVLLDMVFEHAGSGLMFGPSRVTKKGVGADSNHTPARASTPEDANSEDAQDQEDRLAE